MQLARALTTLPVECLQVIEVQAVETAAKAGVIRAPPSQLLQVLGKACPFVGLGLWTVRGGGSDQGVGAVVQIGRRGVAILHYIT